MGTVAAGPVLHNWAMKTTQPTANRRHTALLVLVFALSAIAVPAQGVFAADPSPLAEASTSPAQSACESADDLRLIIDFLRDTDTSVDGYVPVLVGAIAALSEGRQLAGLVGETYRPLVDDLVVALQDLRVTVGELGEQETVGASLESLGVAIADIGAAMDTLGLQLREPCPNA